jgi:hypothetical protein
MIVVELANDVVIVIWGGYVGMCVFSMNSLR